VLNIFELTTDNKRISQQQRMCKKNRQLF